MKVSLIVMGVALCLSSLVASASPQVSLPQTLRCEARFFLVGDLRDSLFGDARVIHPTAPEESAGRLITVDERNRVTIQYIDGDQVVKFDFRRSDLDRLARGLVRAINGNYEEGFYWSQGFSTTARLTISCTSG